MTPSLSRRDLLKTVAAAGAVVALAPDAEAGGPPPMENGWVVGKMDPKRPAPILRGSPTGPRAGDTRNPAGATAPRIAERAPAPKIGAGGEA